MPSFSIIFQGGSVMLKRFISMFLVFSLLLAMPMTVLANPNNIRVKLNDTEALLESEIYFNEKGQLMCPLREIAEELGYIINWNDEDKSVEILKEEHVVKLNIDKEKILINDEEFYLNSTVILKDGKTFVPVEFFSNALNLIVGWDSKSNSLKIRQPRINTEDYFKISENQSITDELNSYMETLQKNRNFHGNVLVAKNGEILLNAGYGFADFHQNTTNKSQTRFAVGSITKQFVSMAIMQLYEKGLIDVEDKISKYLPDFPQGDSITIHNLLIHTSGLVNFTDLPEFYLLDLERADPMTVVNLIKDLPLQFQPGEKYSYCNTNYLLLGIIVEKVSGMTYEEYLHENIFKPLNMKDTGILFGENNEIYDATAYAGFLEVIPVDDEILLRHAYGAGNIYSTVEDIYRWDRALKTDKLVEKETLDKIFTGHMAISEEDYYGYGWIITDTGLGKMVSHGGGTLGFTAYIARFIDEDLTIIILTNNQGYDVTNLTNTLISIVYGIPYEIPEALEEIEIGDLTLYDKFVGEYLLAPGTTITITRDDNGIYAQLTGQEKFEIFPKSENEYFYKVVDAQITFVVNPEGEVTNLILHQLGLDMNATKIK